MVMVQEKGVLPWGFLRTPNHSRVTGETQLLFRNGRLGFQLYAAQQCFAAVAFTEHGPKEVESASGFFLSFAQLTPSRQI